MKILSALAKIFQKMEIDFFKFDFFFLHFGNFKALDTVLI